MNVWSYFTRLYSFFIFFNVTSLLLLVQQQYFHFWFKIDIIPDLTAEPPIHFNVKVLGRLIYVLMQTFTQKYLYLI